MVADMAQFEDPEQLEAWLRDKPVDWARALAARSALRVFPMVFDIASISEWEFPTDQEQGLILSVWRATFISWAARQYPAHNMFFAAADAVASARSSSSAVASARASAASANYAASAAAAADKADAADAAANAADYAALAGASAAANIVWETISADAHVLLASESPYNAVSRLFAMPLWIEPLAESERYQTNSPEFTRQAYDRFVNQDWVRGSSWELITDWYKAILPNDRNAKPRSLWGEDIDVEIATQPDKFWDRDPEEVLAAITEILASGQGGDANTSETMKEFIVATLEQLERPVSIDEFETLFREAGYNSPRESIRGRLNELNKDNHIQRVDRARYASLNWIDPSHSRPPTPEAGPGPQYGIIDGKLAALASPPTEDETAAQARLLARLKRDLDVLHELSKPIGNSHPHLAGTIAEYRDLLSADTHELDVTGLWSVGSSLAGYAQAFREQNTARTLSEPLEPQLDGLLHSVVRQHGALILGFEEGRDLVSRADEFALDRNRLAEIEQPGNQLLNELSENADLVDAATRELHTPVRDYLYDVGWMANRVGYSGYLIIRNSVRAVIHLAIGRNPSIAVIVGALAGGSAMLGDPNMELLRAALPFLRENAVQLAAFFNHSLEMKAYLEWALQIVGEVEAAEREGGEALLRVPGPDGADHGQ